MPDSPKPFNSPYRCFDCGSEVGFRSRRRTFAERFLLPIFLLQPVRCGECFRRDYRLIFTSVHERLSDASNFAAPKIMPARHRSTSDRNVA
jgi:DNA-directed RNA polymerase subunit N (RpoN/RPB10)